MKKVNVFRSINAIIWIVLTICVMVWAYKAWSSHGEYTILSFFVSLIIHGGINCLIGCFIDKIIKKNFE